MTEKFDQWHDNHEVFVGLIAPIGVNLNSVQSALTKALASVSYEVEAIRLTNSLKPNHDQMKKEGIGLFDRYERLIEAGNRLRTSTVPDVFSYIALQEIMARRGENGHKISDRRATILRQFKRTEEIDLLRKVYGSNIIFIACQAPQPVRMKYFVDQLMSESRTKSRTFYESQALSLIAKDEHETDDPNGQRLLDTYARADFVIDCSTAQTLSASCERFVQAFFGFPFISPSIDEYGAFIASTAALRSTDLSRQVGAAIFQPGGEIVAMGCNEVPKFGGGTYWTGDPHDARDFRIGHDSNVRIKNDLINDFLRHLATQGWQPPEGHATLEDALENAMVQDLLEFGRVIHAEMNAITDASRFGRRTQGATLYCTTLPCHMCSRHIVAAGIHRVVFFQPYHKSLARELYPDSISFDGRGVSGNAVSFSSFSGVTPNAFQKVFSKGRRKDGEGQAVDWTQTLAEPINLGSPEYIQLEALALSQFQDVQSATPEREDAPEPAGGATGAGS